MNNPNRGPRGASRRQTMIEPEQFQNVGTARSGSGRRKTIIEEESPERLSNAFGTAEPAPSQTAAKQVPTTRRFSPTIRPPVAKLFILDDSGLDAEVIRIRGDQFQIGRSVGDLVIGHDGQMSGEHAKIERRQKAGQWSWHLIDLDSTNGTFLRVTEVPLENDLEFWLGGRLYRFQLNDQPVSATPDRRSTGTLVASGQFAEPTQTAVLIEVTPTGDTKQYPLYSREQWIGRDPQKCSIVIDDPMLGSQDAIAFIDNDGKWGLRKGKSLNGIWVRVSGVPLAGLGMQFQCGEQRFALRVD